MFLGVAIRIWRFFALCLNLRFRRPSLALANAAQDAGDRISRRFQELAATGELGFVAYVTAGDPSIEATEKIVLAAADAGADVIELGVPFSDPVADGPTIQRASERALASGHHACRVCLIWCAHSRAFRGSYRAV